MTEKCTKIRMPRVKKNLLHYTYNGEEQKIRVSNEANDALCLFLQRQVNREIDRVLDKLPRKSTGDLKRITIQDHDVSAVLNEKRIYPDETHNTIQYVMRSQIQPNLKVGDQKIRLSSEFPTQQYFWQLMDETVETSMKHVINTLPKKSRGEEKGKIMRVTIVREDLQ